MPQQVKISGFGRPGFVKDIAEYDTVPEAFNEVRNVRFNTTGAVTFPGQRAVFSPADVQPRWIKVFPPIENPLWVYGTLNGLFTFDGTHSEITRVSSDYNGDATERWHGDVFQGVGIFNNTVDVPQYWADFNAATPLVDLPNWPSDLRAKFIRPHGNFLIAGHTLESGNARPYRVRWSDAAVPGTVPSSWALNDPTKLSGEIDLAETDDYVVDGLTLGDTFIVYKQRSVHVLQYVGLPNVFAPWPIIQGRGLLHRDCVQPYRGGHFVAGIDDLYVHSGQRNSEQSVVEAQLRTWIFNQIDANNFFNCFTVKYTRRNEIWFCFPEAGATFATIAVVWNELTGGIGIRDLPGTPFIYPGPVIVLEEDLIWGDEADSFYLLLESEDRLITEGSDPLIQE